MTAKRWTLDTLRSRCEVVAGCWLWQEGMHHSGQPQACINGRPGQLVRRWAVQQRGEPMSLSKTVRLRCADPRCVNPAHLMVVGRSASNVKAHAARRRLERMRAASSVFNFAQAAGRT